MIYPTPRAILLMAAGAPVALGVAMFAPHLWLLGPAWIVAVLLLTGADAALGASGRRVRVDVAAPYALPAGGGGVATAHAQFDGFRPSQAELILQTNARMTVSPARIRVVPRDGLATAELSLIPRRRGEGMLEKLWVRWRGPFGLAWTQVDRTLDRAIPVTPNIKAVQDEALRLFSRDAHHGMKVQIDTGEGAEFHALRDFMPGMDRRTIDWKQSARHARLVSKERRTERNHQVFLALDSGRAMCEPLDGVPRIDRAINAALLLAYISLKIGDRVGLFAFDSKPRISTGAVGNASAFELLQRTAARIDYSPEETNYTLGLTTLSGDLDRRSLVVVFTDFADPTGAELMLENLGRLLKRHVVLFVVLRDAELEAIARTEPRMPEDVSRAATAAALLREREVVLARLRRMGVQVLDAPAALMGPALANAYLDIKRRELL